MMFVDYILQWARDKGYAAVYGSPEQVNEMLTNVPFASSQDGTAVIMHLVADSETYNGHDRAIVAVYFASLCPFDFDGESLLSELERLKNIGKDLLNDIRTGNTIAYSDPRWQYGYDDYAENVCWVCLRVAITALAADCVPLPGPPAPDIASIPQAAFEWLALQGLSPVLRQHCATSQAVGFPASISACWAVVSDSDLGTLHYTAQVGDDTAQGDAQGVEIDSALVAQLPALDGMEGKWLYLLEGAAQVWDSGEVCASASLGSVWQSGSDCWEVEVPESDFLNFYMPFGGTIILRRVGSPTVAELEYSTDGCRTWQIWEEVGIDRTLILPQEWRVWIRNTSETSTGFSLSSADYYRFLFDSPTFGYGNTDSLLCKNSNNAVLTPYCYWRLFYGTDIGPLLKSPNLMAKNAATYCYSQMYYNNKNTVVPPIMLLENAAEGCCSSMFESCIIRQLPIIYIKTLAKLSFNYLAFGTKSFTKVVTYMTDISAIGSLGGWMANVGSSGDFYCDPNLTIPTGPNGIPSGWTRHDLSELE